jgi:hypothetical protein
MPNHLLLDNRNVLGKQTPPRVSRPDDADKGPDAALQAFQIAASYDALRLRIYRDNEELERRIQIASIGSATALRFDDVGYFNRVYSHDESINTQLPAIEGFYSTSSFGCELIGQPIGPRIDIDPVFPKRGWVLGCKYAWLHGRTPRLAGTFEAGNYVVRQPRPEERIDFLLTYLSAFEAQPERIGAAVRNMRHLFNSPVLHFLMAFKDGDPAGIGMMYQVGKSAMLCAGATLPGHRGQGCHAALLDARIRLAIECGCADIFSWATFSGQSRANMERAGLKTVGITQAWRYRAKRAETGCRSQEP